MELFNHNFLIFTFDKLSLFFLIVLGIVCLPSFIYSLGYIKEKFSPRRTVLLHALTIIFILSMALVITAANIILFFVAWEIMSLLSYLLVVFDYEDHKSVQAGTIYIVMTHIGTAFLIFAFMLMYKYAGSFDFTALKGACLLMPSGARNLVFLLLLVGFGTKAGVVPLHIWLPYAHPQAPSHISAIMSGVMIKTAIYGLIRFVIYIMGVYEVWWGILILALAGISCLVGVVYALIAHDIKKLLAYHSVENIGIILLGVGAAIIFLGLGLDYLAVFSLAAGLYHLINHAIFKGLLFLGAGSVYQATGTRDMEKMGGLIKKMPQTAFYFLLGALAISGIPPLNGFVSEWLTLQALFLGFLQNTAPGIKVFLALSAATLAFTGGLAAACFVKAFGITFLAMPRSRYADNAHESGLAMRMGMFFLALLTIIFGIAAPCIFKILTGICGEALSLDTGPMSFRLNSFILSPKIPGFYAQADPRLSTAMIAFMLLVFGAVSWGLYRMISHKAEVKNRVWGCGYYALGARNEYTATAFSKPFRVAFNFFLLPYRRTQKVRETFYHVSSFVYETHTTLIFKKYIYDPILSGIFGIAKRMKKIQSGSIHLYIGYIFLTIILLIVFMEIF